MADDGGMLTKSRLSQNPFAIKTVTPTRSLADSTEGKESRPLLAPPTLKWGTDSFCGVSSSSPKIFLRPSPLAAQAEKLKATITTQNAEKTECDKSETTFAADCLGQTSQGSISGKGSGSCRSEFVFGQNLHERVVVCTVPQDAKPLAGGATDVDGPSDLSFEAAASHKEDQDDDSAKPSKSLSESAEEYQSKQVKRKFDQVTVITGEEEESNVLQMNCKLFTFDKTLGSWEERGRGFLRLNDREVDGTLRSRLVMRTQGSLRVVLNTKVWMGMSVEHSSQKTLRISAIDSNGIRVFLIMANPKDIDQLFGALDWRVAMLKSQDDRPESTANQSEEEVRQKRWRRGYDDLPESSLGSVSPDLSSNGSFPTLEES